MEVSAQFKGVPLEIRTVHVHNISPERYRHTSLLGHTWADVNMLECRNNW
jgi:hypothetical protein